MYSSHPNASMCRLKNKHLRMCSSGAVTTSSNAPENVFVSQWNLEPFGQEPGPGLSTTNTNRLARGRFQLASHMGTYGFLFGSIFGSSVVGGPSGNAQLK